MHAYGFSTGALALGDFKKALEMLAGQSVDAVELSALRDHELPALMAEASNLDLSAYSYVSIHAPSKFSSLSERAAADLLEPCIERGWPIVLHPDAIRDAGSWDRFGELLCLENMDKRKPVGRTAAELTPWFERFPKACFCLDLGHARQVDPSLTIAHDLVNRFGTRLKQIHLSELDHQSRHVALSVGTVSAVRELASRLRPVAVILESVVAYAEIPIELEMARTSLDYRRTEAPRLPSLATANL
jgi:hypothetical protein